MKKVNLESLGLDSSEKLGRSQMKSIHGGIMLEDFYGCDTTCGNGFYACCNNGKLSQASCKCHGNAEVHTCESGGPGSSSCAIVDND